MNSPTISIIAATDEAGGIGKDDRIPWHIKKDLVRLAAMTLGRIAVIGGSSYKSMAGYYDISGRDMPAKKYIVITRDKNFKSARNNTEAVFSIDEALTVINKSGEEEVFIIGGASIYKQMLKHVNRLYMTVVEGKFDCDTFFPDYSDFKEVKSEEDSDDNYKFEFKILERK